MYTNAGIDGEIDGELTIEQQRELRSQQNAIRYAQRRLRLGKARAQLSNMLRIKAERRKVRRVEDILTY